MSYKPGWRGGRWSAICDRCGFRFHSDKIREEWTGLKVCHSCFETRNPQDFLRISPEKIVPPWTRPESTDSSLPVCDQCTSSAYAGLAAAGCAKAGYAPDPTMLINSAECVPDGFLFTPPAPIVESRADDAHGFRGPGAWSISLPSGIQVGDLILVVAMAFNGDIPSAPGYTLIESADAGGGNTIVGVLARTATGADSCTITLSGTVWISAFSWRISGGATSANVSATKDVTTDSTVNCLPPPITGITVPFLSIITGQVGTLFPGEPTGALIGSYPAGYTQGRFSGNNTSSPSGGLVVAEKTCDGGTETPGAIILSAGQWLTSMTIGIQNPV